MDHSFGVLQLVFGQSALGLSASKMNPKPRGRTRSVRTPVAVEREREAVIESPGRSVRKEPRMSSPTAFTILPQDLHFHPY